MKRAVICLAAVFLLSSAARAETPDLAVNGEVGKAPTILGSASKVKQAVAGTTGAIGFILASEVDSTVKVVKVAGLAPGQSGYPVSLK